MKNLLTKDMGSLWPLKCSSLCIDCAKRCKIVLADQVLVQPHQTNCAKSINLSFRIFYQSWCAINCKASRKGVKAHMSTNNPGLHTSKYLRDVMVDNPAGMLP